MVITDYRVQSVLRTYTRQLQRSKLTSKGGWETGGEPSAERVSISDEGKRRLMMDRLTSQVLEKMYPRQDEEEAEVVKADPEIVSKPGSGGNL